MKQLFLHVGPEKTGTSALQSFLSRKSAHLSESGFLYPETARWSDGSHHGLAFSLLKVSNWQKAVHTRAAFFDQIGNEIDASTCTSTIISSEILRAVCLREEFDILAERLLSKFDQLTLVLFLRDQVEWLISMFNQHVKDPNVKHKGAFRDFAQRLQRDADWLDLIYCWRKRLDGLDLAYRLVLIPYLPHKYNVIEQFCDAVGLDRTRGDWGRSMRHDTDSAVNASLGRIALDIIHFFNGIDMDFELRLRLNKLVVETYPNVGRNLFDGDYSVITRKEFKEILRRYTQSNSILAEQYAIEPFWRSGGGADAVRDFADRAALANIILSCCKGTDDLSAQSASVWRERPFFEKMRAILDIK